jgi:MmgE/PrpD C-terminal domain
VAIAGRETSIAGFTDASVADRDLRELRSRVEVIGDRGDEGMETEIRLLLRDGSRLSIVEDSSRAPVNRDLDVEWAQLAAKFRALAEPVVGTSRALELMGRLQSVESQPDVSAVLELAHPDGQSAR